MIHTGSSIYLSNGTMMDLLGKTEEEIKELLNKYNSPHMSKDKENDTPVLMETPYGNWTPYGFKVHLQFTLNTNLKLGTVLEFQRQIQEHIKDLSTKVEDPKLRREIDEINYIYTHLLEHI